MGKYSIKLLEKKEIAKHTWQFTFKKPEGFLYEAGQWVKLSLIAPPETDEKGTSRSFTLSSSPSEPTLAITTRMRNSAFKRVLQHSALGTEFTMIGAFGSFTLKEDEQKPLVFLTGGIGITPFYSILKECSTQGTSRSILLIYSNKTKEEITFFEELQTLESTIEGLKVICTLTQHDSENWTGKKGRISKDMLRDVITDITTPHYYIAGPPTMVSGLKALLEELQVPPEKVLTEDFSGY